VKGGEYPGELKLDNQLCYIIHRLDQAIVARYRPLLDELSLTYTQYIAMLVLWEKEDMTIGELCTALYLDTGTVSPLAKRLEKAGLVWRKRDENDERTVRIGLTDEGRSLRQSAHSIPAAIASCLLSGEQEYRDVRQMLTGLLSRVDNGPHDGGKEGKPL